MKYIFIVSALLVSCSHPQNKRVGQTQVEEKPLTAMKESFATGKVIPKVICKSNPAFSFALYLPSDYDTTKKFPCIIFFDPHAGGEFVLRKYQHLAEEFNFILLGSNDSKNGLSMDQTNQIATSLISDATSRFSTFKDVSLAGFSGGAKVALTAASQHINVKEVIYCGAALQPSEETRTYSPLGFAGTQDMNYTDVKTFDFYLNKHCDHHFLIEWRGKHEWPDSSTFRDAFYWIAFNQMLDLNLKGDRQMIEQFTKENLALAEASQDPYEKDQYYQKLIFFPDGLVDTSPYSVKHAQISSTEEYKKEIDQRVASMKQESAQKEVYMQSFQSQDLKWWKKETQRLSASKNPSDQRLLGFISLAGYSISSNAIQQNNFPVAEKMLAIYQLADPTNSDQPFLEACFYAKQGKNDTAIQSLQRAVDLGLNDPSKITGEESLQPLLSDTRLQALMAKMK